MINNAAIDQMKKGVMLISTGFGRLVNAEDVVQSLKCRRVGNFGMDVYEEEGALFFQDHLEDIIQDDAISRPMTFQNILITSRQVYLIETSLRNITETTLYNLECFYQKKISGNEIYYCKIPLKKDQNISFNFPISDA